MLAFLRAMIYVNHSLQRRELSLDNMYLFNVGIYASVIMYRPFEVELRKINHNFVVHNSLIQSIISAINTE